MLAGILATLSSGSTPPPIVITDRFDSLLNQTCTILGREAGARDSYGQTPRTLEILEEDVPCRVSRLSGSELAGLKEFSLRQSKIYMRPWAIDGGVPSSPRSLAEATGKVELNPKMVIRVGDRTFNIKNVANPSLVYHHLEVIVEEVVT